MIDSECIQNIGPETFIFKFIGRKKAGLATSTDIRKERKKKHSGSRGKLINGFGISVINRLRKNCTLLGIRNIEIYCVVYFIITL